GSDRVAALAADGAAYVAWTIPVAQGGAPVTGYTVTSSGGQQVSVSAADFNRLGYVRVPDLTNGTPYTFTVTARNAHGTGQVSMPTAPVTPAASPARPPGPPDAV